MTYNLIALNQMNLSVSFHIGNLSYACIASVIFISYDKFDVVRILEKIGYFCEQMTFFLFLVAYLEMKSKSLSMY